MEPIVVLEWKFSPPDYFEVPIEIVRDDYTLTIADGKAEARITDEVYSSDSSMRQTLQGALNDRFLGAQLVAHKPYQLSKSAMARVHPDGHKDIFLEAKIAGISVTANKVDIQILDQSGIVIADSKRDRIQQKKNLADLVDKHRSSDEVLNSLICSYDSAVRDSANELVHLYEIRDALSIAFGGEKASRQALGILSSGWSRLGELANNEPLSQGRHRGKAGIKVRDATDAELSEARGIARGMIEAYLLYLDDAHIANP